MTLVMDVWAAGALPPGLVVKSIHCPSGSSKFAITSFTWYSGTACSLSRDLHTLAPVKSVIFNGSHATRKGTYNYTRALTGIYDQRLHLLKGSGQGSVTHQTNQKCFRVYTIPYEYFQSLTTLTNFYFHSMMPTKAPSDSPVNNYEMLTMHLRRALTMIYSR